MWIPPVFTLRCSKRVALYDPTAVFFLPAAAAFRRQLHRDDLMLWCKERDRESVRLCAHSRMGFRSNGFCGLEIGVVHFRYDNEGSFRNSDGLGFSFLNL